MYIIKLCLISAIYIFPVIFDISSAWAYLPTDDECGITIFDGVKNRIIDGKRAALGQFPWLARLSVKSMPNPFFKCGGALINRFYILTAAHCGDIKVARLGENDASTEIDCEGHICAPPYQDFEVKKRIINKFVPEIYGNDIALLLLNKPVQYNEFVVPVCLPHGEVLETNFIGSSATVAGWGIKDVARDIVSKELLYTVLPIIEPNKCSDRFVQPTGCNQYCLGYDKGTDTCSGDSGGPLTKSLKVDGRRRFYILGIVSYGLETCGTGPAVYTNVMYYLEWILKNVKQG